MPIKNKIACIFDFDSTLTTDSTSELLDSRGIDVHQFWGEISKLVKKEKWDPTLAWLNRFIREARPGGALDGLSNTEIANFGKSVKFYPGVEELFPELQKLVAQHQGAVNVEIDFYIISGGLEAMILNSGVAKHMAAIRGCCFDEDPDSGSIAFIKNVVSFTGKTRYLYEINKGVIKDGRTKPFAVNAHKMPSARPVPFEHMIYVGDGLTDVPSFSVVDSQGGFAFGVRTLKEKDKPKKAWERLVAPRRVINVSHPDYREDALLGFFLRQAVTEVCERIEDAA